MICDFDLSKILMILNCQCFVRNRWRRRMQTDGTSASWWSWLHRQSI